MSAKRSNLSPDAISPHSLARGKYIALLGLMGLGLAGVWHSAQSDIRLRIDQGQANQPHKILIWAHGDRGIENWVNTQTLTHGPYAYRNDPSPVSFEAQRVIPKFPASLGPEQSAQALDEILSGADEQGFGYIALDLQGPQSADTRTMLTHAAPALEIPKDTRWAVIRSDRRVNNLELSTGRPQSGIRFQHQAASRASLMQALLGDPDLFALYRAEREDEVLPPTELESMRLAKQGVNLQKIAWQEFPLATLSHETISQWPQNIHQSEPQGQGPLWLAGPMTQVDAIPLDEQHLLLKTSPLLWENRDGTRAHLASQSTKEGWSLSLAQRSPQGLTPKPCEGLDDLQALAVRVSLQGDAFEARLPDNSHQLYALQIHPDGGCKASLQSHTPAGSQPLALGLPQALGRSSWIAAKTDKKTLAWRQGTKKGRLTLPVGHFIQEGWVWEDEQSLLAITSAPESQAPWLLERLRIDPETQELLGRETVETYEDEASARAALSPRVAWTDLTRDASLRFGARIIQVMLTPEVKDPDPSISR